MDDITKRYEELILEVGRLRGQNEVYLATNKALCRSQFVHCIGCQRLGRDESGIFYVCPLLGHVDPFVDGCTRRDDGRRL